MQHYNNKRVNSILYNALLSENAKKRFERIIVVIAIVSFILHLAIIILERFDIIQPTRSQSLITNPIGAIYTPFSFIIIYEVYLLIYYLPKSITGYIGKQYEIITLIIIRRLFKDLATMKISSELTYLNNDLQFIYDLLATIILFFLIYLFYRVRISGRTNRPAPQFETSDFVKHKKNLSLLLVPVFLGLGIYSIVNWINSAGSFVGFFESIKFINKVFFNDFFTLLILIDVLLLLISMFYVDKFNIVIRNSGFIISTILIRLSFGTEGLLNNGLIITAVVYGILLLYVSNKFEHKIKPSTRV